MRERRKEHDKSELCKEQAGVKTLNTNDTGILKYRPDQTGMTTCSTSSDTDLNTDPVTPVGPKPVQALVRLNSVQGPKEPRETQDWLTGLDPWRQLGQEGGSHSGGA